MSTICIVVKPQISYAFAEPVWDKEDEAAAAGPVCRCDRHSGFIARARPPLVWVYVCVCSFVCDEAEYSENGER